jgi:PAS domain-containing protein
LRTKFRFTEESGLKHLRHRTYNPAIYRKNSHALFACSQISGISLHKQTEEQKTQNLDCQKLYKKYKAIFECSGDPIVIAEIKGTDSRGRVIVEVNEAAIKHFGYSRSELLSHDTSFLHPEEEVNTCTRIKSNLKYSVLSIRLDLISEHLLSN